MSGRPDRPGGLRTNGSVRTHRDCCFRQRLKRELTRCAYQAVEITLDNGVLSLSGERHDEKSAHGTQENGLQQQRTERRMGRFYRRFILPDTADAENVKATGRNGVLDISIAKHAKAQPRRITVS